MHKIQFRNFDIVNKYILKSDNGNRSPQKEHHFSKFSTQVDATKLKPTFLNFKNILINLLGNCCKFAIKSSKAKQR